MGVVKISDHILHATADAIRFKTGKSGDITPREMPGEILSISGGSASTVPLYTKAEWDALTAAQKQSFGLVALQSESSGYARGFLVNGADYTDFVDYLPNAVPETIICGALTTNYNSQYSTWGDGTRPLRITNGPLVVSGDGVNIYSNSNNMIVGLTAENETSDNLTIYAVIKALSNPGNYGRLVTIGTSGTRNSIGVMGSNPSIWTYAATSYSNVSSRIGYNTTDNYIAIGLVLNRTGDSFGVVNGYYPGNLNPYSNVSARCAIGRTDIAGSESPTDVSVKFFAALDTAELANDVIDNVKHLCNVFNLPIAS